MNHQHIIDYVGLYHDSGTLYILTEWASGGSLRRMLKQFGPMSEGVVRCYARQILSALAHIHERGVAHRDIKPANILLSTSGTIKVADFGTAVRVDSALVPVPTPGAPGAGAVTRRRKVRHTRRHHVRTRARQLCVRATLTPLRRRPSPGRRHTTLHESGARCRRLR